MRKILFGFIICVIVLTGIWFFAGQATESERGINHETEITLQQEVSREYSPDIACIVLGVETEDAEVDKAFSENNERMVRIREALEELGELEIDTSQFRVQPRRIRDEDGERQVYRVSNRIEVETGEMVSEGHILQRAVESGANEIMSLNYSLSDETEAKNELTEVALDRLNDKIKNIKENIGGDEIRLDSIIVEDHNISPGQSKFHGAVEEMQLQTDMPPVSPVDVEVRVNLQAIYIIN